MFQLFELWLQFSCTTLRIVFFCLRPAILPPEMSGKSEANMRRLFDNAKSHAPSLLFFDEIDCITAKRDGAGKEMERRIVAQFLSCMDDLSDCASGSNVIVMGATNRPEALDASLRRAGRFDREINLGVPDEAGASNPAHPRRATCVSHSPLVSPPAHIEGGVCAAPHRRRV